MSFVIVSCLGAFPVTSEGTELSMATRSRLSTMKMTRGSSYALVRSIPVMMMINDITAHVCAAEGTETFKG